MNFKPGTRPETKHGKKAKKCTESKLGFKIKSWDKNGLENQWQTCQRAVFPYPG